MAGEVVVADVELLERRNGHERQRQLVLKRVALQDDRGEAGKAEDVVGDGAAQVHAGEVEAGDHAAALQRTPFQVQCDETDAEFQPPSFSKLSTSDALMASNVAG